MHPTAREYYCKVKELYEHHVKGLIAMRALVEKTADLKELVDWAYAINQSSKFLDEMRKNINGIEDLAERIACLIYMQTGCAEPIRTPHVTGTPNIKMIATLPKRRKPDGAQNPEWIKLMTHLGVPKHLVEIEDQHAVDFHFPGLMAYLTRLQMEGRPLPPGVDTSRTYPEYTVKLTPRRGVDESL